MARIRVVIVEDSNTIRAHLREILETDEGMEVVGEAGDGKSAIEMCSSLRPDVVTMDMILPVMSGMAATEYIMAYAPTPILIVSASTNRGELFKTYEALAAGAVDVLEKPRGDEPEGVWEKRFIDTVRMVSRIRVITHPRARLQAMEQYDEAAPPAGLAAVPGSGVKVVAIGASTGGPAAILEILRNIPAAFPLPILIVLHISEPFGAALAEWLDGQIALPVRCAEKPRLIAECSGQVILAPPDRHLIVRNRWLMLSSDAERHSCRPSVDVLFESVAVEFGPAAMACLLTGMGRDGAAGLLAIRRAGGVTIAQDEATSVVYGMPREAALMQAAERILPLHDIGVQLLSLAARPR